MTGELVMRAITPDEIPAFRDCMLDVFAADPALDPEGLERLRAIIDCTRTYCIFDGDVMVATAGTHTFSLAVCGGRATMGGLTGVTVRPTHRRRGILRRLIAAHLADVAARGEVLSGLWASEGSIYGRFGYGVAAEGDELELSPDDGYRGPRDEVVRLDLAAARATLPAVYERAQAIRPGLVARTEAWWRYRRFADRPDQRHGRAPRQYVITRRGGEITGYAFYLPKLDWKDGRAAGTVDIEELIALDGVAEATLWHHLTHLDLLPRVSHWNAPTDALPRWIAADRRSVVRRLRHDTLWLRLTDVPGALAARRYASDGALRLAVDDGTRGPTWQLTADGGAGRCEATTAAPELVLAPAALGSIYLGGVAPSLLARAGSIDGDPAAVGRADRLFTWPIAPWCADIF